MIAPLLMLLATAGDLAPLHAWPPAGSLVEDVVATARGDGGVSDRDARRLRNWTRRFLALHPDVRAWYAARAGHPAVGPALWCVLDHRPTPDGPSYGRLLSLWEFDHGTRPGFDLCPRLL